MHMTTIFVGLVLVHPKVFGDKLSENHSVVLSRRKRFLIFPEGSSVQLVFCNTFPNISPIVDIVLWGYTAALAYELPQNPYSPFNHHADPLHRRADTKSIYFTDEDGKVLLKKAYHKKFLVNPAFAKRSVDGHSPSQLKKGARTKLKTDQKLMHASKLKMDRKLMHASKHKRDFLKSEHMEARSVEFHRSGRGSLYQKVETMLQGLGGNGRQCLLKTLCLVGQTSSHPQGTFFQELLRAVFTLPQGDQGDIDEEYDEAMNTSKSCDEAYPDCNHIFSEL